ncbi:glycosyltransferase family 2 protein [Cetobacterium somerae]|uniref:glycosyltransferase family 2 protein n=1 Tax=Cetobacterium somerae TaxID=188913 RepID=UPI00211E026B|nr:glycosyltransferase family A protein [Cetobacterium somerae]MCQ9626461.1 glycosyltransferase family 2 protein [Cetobacterium somerae]
MSCFKKSNPKVSIVVPIYNGEKYINRCLESILNQSYKDFEVILIDDGSKDSSLKKLCDYEKKDTRIRVFTQKNSGPSAARNRGIKESEGEYLIFIDIDDYVSEFYLEKNLLKMDKKTLILSNVLEVFTRKTEKREIFDKKSCSLEKIEVLKSIINGKAGLVCGKLIDLKMLKNKKILFDENIEMCEDQLFFLEVALESEEFYYESEYLYYYDRRDNSSLSLKYKKN